MKKQGSFLLLLMLCFSVYSQSITLQFTGQDASSHRVQLDRVIVTNLSQNWQETIYWPDTTLTLSSTDGIDDYANNSRFSLLQNNPNPFNGTTDVNLTVADAGVVALEIADANGRIVGAHRVRPQLGTHQFRVTLSAAGTYIMTARQNGKTSSIKMINNGGGGKNAIEEIGIDERTIAMKSGEATKGNVVHPWTYGDNLTIMGCATICGTECTKQFSRQLLYNETITIYFSESITTPTVAASSVSNITSDSASVSSSVSGDCGVTSRGFCYGTTGSPTISGQHTSNGSGTGSFTGTLSGLTPGTTYYVRAYATNAAGTAYGNEVSFTTEETPQDGQPCQGAATLTDRDGNTYNTVQIGTQCWMKENLRTTHYDDNTAIPAGSTASYTEPYRYAPNVDESNVAIYGYLYNWVAVMHGQGICPTGWHVPSDAEWTQLSDYVSSQSQYVCGSDNTYIAKALASTTGWESSTITCAVGNTPSGNNATGFSALPAGRYEGLYGHFGYYAYFWSATERNGSIAYGRYLRYGNRTVTTYNDYKSYGFSVRCLRD